MKINNAVRPIHPVEWLLDWLMMPIMWTLQCCRIEALQRTRRWNNHHLDGSDVEYLDRGDMVFHRGDPNAHRPWLLGVIPLFHLPCLGGWKQYVVIRPRDHLTIGWHVGWIAGEHAIGVSRIPLSGRVKVLVGPGECQWFGITAKGEQVALRKIGQGRLGDSGPWRYVPLR